MIEKIIRALVKERNKEIFSIVAKKFNLKSGDCSPEMSIELDNINSSMSELLLSYVKGNQK